MEYLECIHTKANEFIVLEPEDWTEEQWKGFEKLFGFEKAERIVIMEYYLRAYGEKKERSSL